METNEMFAQMLGILRRETELYQVMSIVMDKEKDAAIQSNLIALNEAEIEKENVLVALGLLEKQRLDLVSALADSVGHPTRELNLDRISQIADEPFSRRLKQARSELKTVLESYRLPISAINKYLSTLGNFSGAHITCSMRSWLRTRFITVPVPFKMPPASENVYAMRFNHFYSLDRAANPKE